MWNRVLQGGGCHWLPSSEPVKQSESWATLLSEPDVPHCVQLFNLFLLTLICHVPVHHALIWVGSYQLLTQVQQTWCLCGVEWQCSRFLWQSAFWHCFVPVCRAHELCSRPELPTHCHKYRYQWWFDHSPHSLTIFSIQILSWCASLYSCQFSNNTCFNL